MRIALVALLLMLLPLIAVSQPLRTAKWTILPLAHPNARLLLGLDWRRVLDSPLGKVVQDQVSKGGHPLLGFLDSIENVDRILVSSPGADDGEKAPLLVIGEGRFLLPRIREMAKADGALSRKYNDVELLVPPNATNADLHFALLDGHTILFGDGSSVKQAIDRWQRATQEAHDRNPVFFRAATLSTMQEIWAVVHDPASSLSALGISGSGLAEQVENVEFGITVGQTLDATVWIKGATEEAGEMLATGLPALLQLAALTYHQQPSLAQVARRLKVVNEKEHVKMGVSIDAKLFGRSMDELRASTVTTTTAVAAPQSAAAQLPPAAAAAAASDGPPQRRVVRIVGMDEGVKEIPYEVKRPD
ncbi:MAG: hypothetical protein JST93_19200 [Acidobacteria bacterium]|nr:hypothetical protein [Acidobacteriota bacterium]